AIHVDEKLLDYILGIIEKTRRDPRLRLGASPRGAICLTRAAQAHAALEGRAFISPYDIKHIAVPALAHRVLLSADALVEGVDAGEVIAELVEQVPVPTLSRITSVL
ncbi:MAG: AAA family ATPase, partial [Planctomycetota bacterium]